MSLKKFPRNALVLHRGLEPLIPRMKIWCPNQLDECSILYLRRDSNPYSVGSRGLNSVCRPIPPLRHWLKQHPQANYLGVFPIILISRIWYCWQALLQQLQVKMSDSFGAYVALVAGGRFELPTSSLWNSLATTAIIPQFRYYYSAPKTLYLWLFGCLT